jgi:hypothetical protein
VSENIPADDLADGRSKLSCCRYAFFRLSDCRSGALDRANAPPGFIGHGRFQLCESGAQLLERGLHMRLTGPCGS